MFKINRNKKLWDEFKVTKKHTFSLIESVEGFLKIDNLSFKIILIDFAILLALFLMTHPSIVLSIVNTILPKLMLNEIIIIEEIEESNHLQNIFALHAGITALIFPIVFFIAEKLRSDEKDEGRVLLRESYFWHVVFLGTGLFLNFIICGNSLNKTSSLLVLVVYTFLVLQSIRSIIQVLLNPTLLDKKTNEMYKQRMERYNEDLLKLRVENNAYAKYIDKSESTKLSIISSKEDPGEMLFFSDLKGLIKKINQSALASFIEKTNEFSQTEQRVEDTEVESSKVTKSKIAKKEKVKIKFYKLIGTRLTSENNKIIGIIGVTGAKFKKLNKLAQQIYIVDDKSRSFDENVRIELESIRDNLIQNIRNNNLSGIERRIDQLRTVTLVFLESLKTIHSTYGYNEAQKESASFYDRWSHIDEVKEIIDDAFIETLKTNNQKLIREIISLPINLAKDSIQFEDHLIFQSFSGYSLRVYYLSQRKRLDTDIKEFIFDRSFRYLSETANYIVIPKIEDTQSIKTINQYQGYLTFIIKTFVGLIKQSYEFKNIEHFRKYCLELSKIAKYFENGNSHTYIEGENLPSYKKAQINLKKKIEEDKEDIFFGIASYILRDFVISSSPKIEEFLKTLLIYLPNRFEDFTEVFIRVHNFEKGEVWGWDWWSISEDDEHFSKVETLPNLEQFYAYYGLQLLKGFTEERIDKTSMPTNRDLYFLADGTRDLLSTLENIKIDTGVWKKILDDGSRAQVENFKKLLTQAKKKQEEEDVETIMKSSIDPQMKKKFIGDVVEAYSKSKITRRIFEAQNKVTSKIDTYKKKPEARGYNQIESKEAFMKDWHVHYSGFGSRFGEGMARSENIRLLKDIQKSLKNVSISELKGISSEWLVFYTGGHFYQLKDKQWEKDIEFITVWDMKINIKNKYLEVLNDFVEGFMKVGDIYVPVIDLNYGSKTEELVLLNPEVVGKLFQYKPIENIADQDVFQNTFSIQIFDLSKEDTVRKEIIESNPEWLKNKKDKEKHLKQKVNIKMFEKFEYLSSKKEEGYVVNI